MSSVLKLHQPPSGPLGDNRLLFCSFLDQVGSEETSCPESLQPPEQTGSSLLDVPAAGHTNITDLINESYQVRSRSGPRIEEGSIIIIISSVLH